MLDAVTTPAATSPRPNLILPVKALKERDHKLKELESQFAQACAGVKKGEKTERLGREKAIDCAIRSGRIVFAMRKLKDWQGEWTAYLEELCKRNDVAKATVDQWLRIAKRLEQLPECEAKVRELGVRKGLDYLQQQYEGMQRNRYRDCQSLEALHEDLLDQTTHLYGQYRERLIVLVGEAGYQNWYQTLTDAQRAEFDQPTLVPLPDALRPSVVADHDDADL
jgi:hypothetical protein